MVASAALVSLDVVLRAVFSMAPLRSFELSTYAFAAATAFSYGFVLLEKKHIRIDAVYRLFPERVQVVFDIVNLLVMTMVAVGLAYHGTRVALDSWAIGASSTSALAMPLIYPQGLWAAGLIWFALCAFALLGAVARDVAAGRWKGVHDKAGIETSLDEV